MKISKKGIKKIIYTTIAILLVLLVGVGARFGYNHWKLNDDCSKYIPRESGILSEDAINCSLYKAISAQDSSLCRITTEEFRDRDYIRQHEDECFNRYAVKQRYAPACKNITDIATQEKCAATVQGIFDNKEDITYCWSLESEKISQCLMELAVERDSSLICDTAPSGTTDAQEYKDACLRKLATFTNDPGKCLLITDSSRQKNCLNELSGVKENKNNIDDCRTLADDKLRHPEAYHCFLGIALEILNPAICRVKNSTNETMTDITDACFEGYAIARKDPVICDEIENKYDHEKCQKLLTLVQKYKYDSECWNQIELINPMAGSMLNCLLDKATKEINAEICNLGISFNDNFDMEIADDQNSCYMMYAIQMMKEQVCDKLFENGSLMNSSATPTECRRRIQLKKDHPDFTESVPEFWTQIAVLLHDDKYCEYEERFNDSLPLTPLENCRKHVEVVKKYPNAEIGEYDSWATIAKKTGDVKYCDYHAGSSKKRMDLCLEVM